MAQAALRQIDAAQALRRFRHLEFQVNCPNLVQEVPTWQLMLASPRGGTLGPWTDFFEPGDKVSAARVWQAKRETGKTYDELLETYRKLGLDPEDPRVVFPVRRPGPIAP